MFSLFAFGNVRGNLAVLQREGAAETGGNEQYLFEAEPRLFDMPADSIVEQFIKHLETTGNHPHPLSYELNSAVKKKGDRFVLATGSLMLPKGELPFLLMISSGTVGQPH